MLYLVEKKAIDILDSLSVNNLAAIFLFQMNYAHKFTTVML